MEDGLRGLDELTRLLPKCSSSVDVFEATLRVLNEHFSVARSLFFLVEGPVAGVWSMSHGWAGARQVPEQLQVTLGRGKLGIALQLRQTMIEARGGDGCLQDWERSAILAPGPGLALYLGAPGPGAFKESDRGYLEVMASLVGYALRDVGTS